MLPLTFTHNSGLDQERADARGRTNARNRSLSAFINEVEAQTGKRVDPADAAVLITIATAFGGEA